MDILLWLSSIKQSFKWASPIFLSLVTKFGSKIDFVWRDLKLLSCDMTSFWLMSYAHSWKWVLKFTFVYLPVAYPLSLKRWFLSAVHRKVIILDGHLTRDVIDLWNAIQVIMVQSHWFTDNQIYIYIYIIA